MPTRRVDLAITPAGHTCKVLLDGEEVKNCRAITVDARVGELSVVTFELVNVDVYVSGGSKVKTTEAVADITSMTDHSRRYQLVEAPE